MAKETSEQRWSLIILVVAINVAVIGLVFCFISNNFGFEKDWILAKFLGMFSFQFLKENPLFLPSDSSKLKKLGAMEWYKFVHGHLGLRLIVCIWFHAGIIHFLANMLNLVYIRIRFQKQFGFVGIIYLLSSLFLQHNFSIGTFRAAMFGLFGAILYELLTNQTIYKAAIKIIFTVNAAIN